MPPVIPDPIPLFFSGTAVLRGVVLDAEGEAPLEGARIFLTPAGVTDGGTGTGGFQPQREVYRTGPDGRFRVDRLQPQRYFLDAEAPGYLCFAGLAAEAYGELTAGRGADGPSSFHADLGAFWDVRWTAQHPAWHILSTLYPEARAGEPVSLELRLRRGRRLRGVVLDPQGRPVSGATVAISGQGIEGYQLAGNYWGGRSFRPPRPTSTDTEGRFELTAHPALRASVKTSAPGCVDDLREVDMRQHEGVLEVVLSPGRGLTGRVLLEEGRDPGREIHVSAFALREGSPIVNGRSEADGTFSLDGLPDPPLMVVANDQFLGAAAAEVSETDSPAGLQLQRERKVRGRVIEASGKPAPGAFVHQQIVLRTSQGDVHLAGFGSGVQRHSDGGWRVAIPLFVQGSTHADPNGAFEVKIVLEQEGRVALTAAASHVLSARTNWSGWVDVHRDVVLRLGSPPEAAAAPEVAVPVAAPVERWVEHLRAAPKEERRRLIQELRDAACRTSGGHPPTGESDRPELVPVFVEALKHDDDDVRSQAVCALSYMNHPKAFEPLLDALRHADETVRYFAAMGVRWMGERSGLREKAVEGLREVLQRDGEAFSVLLNAASSLVELRAYDDPAIFLRALREENANDALAAHALAGLGRRDAIELLIERMKVSDLNYHLNQALHALTGHYAGQQYAAWRAWFDRHRGELPPQLPVEVLPTDAEGWLRRGLRRWKEQDFDALVEDFSRALESDPGHARAWMYRGVARALAKAKDVEAGRKDGEKAVELAPGDTLVWSWLAWLRAEAHDLEGAVAAAGRAVELDPDKPDVWMGRAQLLMKKDDRAAAAADVRRALEKGGPEWERRPMAERLLAELRAEPGASAPQDILLCDDCKLRPATTHVVSMEGGTRKELHRCEPCTNARGGAL